MQRTARIQGAHEESPMRTAIFCLVTALLFTPGCAWVGRTAGKAQAKIERKADTVEGGYKEGYRQEKSKSAAPAPAKPVTKTPPPAPPAEKTPEPSEI